MDHNLRVIHTLFQSNSENWSRIAQEHKNSLGIICNEFLGGVVDHNWPLRMHKQLRTSFLDPQMKDIMKKAQEEVDLLRVDLHFEQHSYDPEYEKRLKYWRTEASKDGPYAEAEEVLEKMLIHSDLLSKTFLSNVVTQIVERHLLQGLLSIFSLVKIIRMDEATVVAIAAENKEIGDKRIALKRKRSPSRRQPIFAPVSPCDGRNEQDTREKISDNDDDDGNNGEVVIDEPSMAGRYHELQMTNPNPFRAAGSFTSTLLKLQSQSPHDERPQLRLSNGESATNENLAHSTTSDFIVPGGRNQPTTKMNDHVIPGAWEDQLPADYSPPPTGAPKHAPPLPPPRPDKIAEQSRSRQPVAVPPKPPLPQQQQELDPRQQQSHRHTAAFVDGSPTYSIRHG
ncbi:hypothetical protein MMC21_002894 [Puttea exsequens]|nr:hypothetical protein [Puttea exsequens]